MFPDDDILPTEPAYVTADVLIDGLRSVDLDVRTAGENEEGRPLFRLLGFPDKLDVLGVAFAALMALPHSSDPEGRNVLTSAAMVLSSGTHATATAFALRELLAGEEAR